MADVSEQYDIPIVECWNCHGEGVVYSCFEEFACLDPESGCDECANTCDICRGKGGWPLNPEDEE